MQLFSSRDLGCSPKGTINRPGAAAFPAKERFLAPFQGPSRVQFLFRFSGGLRCRSDPRLLVWQPSGLGWTIQNATPARSALSDGARGDARFPAQRRQEPGCFGQRLFVFRHRRGIRHDTGTDVEVDRVAQANGCADEDAQLAFAIESKITKTTGVRPARHRLQLVDDLHRSDLWRARDAAPREAFCEEI